MNDKKVSLYDRLPEIYRIKDEEQNPPGQLKNYIGLVEYVFGAIHENIESLYDDLFIETCDDWVIPYIADLLGTSHLSGKPWTLRADVSDTIALRRRKGTLGAVEQLTYDLTQWGVHCVEMRENMAWNQHLNHQRPDAGGKPPYAEKPVIENEEIPILRTRAIRGGTVTLRDPALLSLIGGPFDPFAHTADLKPPDSGDIRYNLPDLAVFLWRLKDYRIILSRPKQKPPAEGVIIKNPSLVVVRVDVHPLGEAVMLFNKNRLDPDKDKPVLKEITELTRLDETPGPINRARLMQGSAGGNYTEYVDVGMYSNVPSSDPADLSDVGLQLHFPFPDFQDETLENWRIRGENLCKWEQCLNPPLKNREIAIDPVLGRIAIGVASEAEGDALNEKLWLTYTYGAVGPVGAHPISRPAPPEEWMGEEFVKDEINVYIDSSHDLKDALMGTGIADPNPDIIEIDDSAIHDLDPGHMGLTDEDGGPNLKLKRTLIIRAASGKRPIIRLSEPLRFRPDNVDDAGKITIRLEGLYITRSDDFPDGEPLIARAALHSLEIIDCTLDPYRKYEKETIDVKDCYESTRKIRPSMILHEPYGFADQEEERFGQIPEISIERTITGPLFIDPGYSLFLHDSIIDAGSCVNDEPLSASFAVSGATGEAKDAWGPETEVDGITVFGRMRVGRVKGQGGIWVHALEVQDNQKGCIKFSYFQCAGLDRLPQNHGCVSGKTARLTFTSEVFGNPAYGQLSASCDPRIRERGPDNDAMGAFGFMLEAHKWRNIGIRYREFMPVGVRLLMIPVT